MLNVESSEIFSHINQAAFTSRFQENENAICMSFKACQRAELSERATK